MTQVRPALAPSYPQADSTPRIKVVSSPSTPPRGFGGLLLRLALLAMLGSTALIALMIGASAAFTPEDGAMAALFGSPECAAPCFFDIRPGETTLEEAYAILSAHPWVKNLTIEPNISESQSLAWQWNGNQPSFLTDKDGYSSMQSFSTTDRIVEIIHIQTRIPYGLIWLTFGEPESAYSTPKGRPSPLDAMPRSFRYDSYYRSGTIAVHMTNPCPFSVRDYWNSEVNFFFISDRWRHTPFEPFSRENWVNSEWC